MLPKYFESCPSQIHGTLSWNQKQLTTFGSPGSVLFNCDATSLIWCCSVETCFYVYI